jgi:tetratricopeptide (TPR) repeat protein
MAVFTGCASQGGPGALGPGAHDAAGYLVPNGMKKLEAGDPDGAALLFEEALKIDKRNVPAMMGMSRVAQAKGRSDDALHWAEEAVDGAAGPTERLDARTLLMETHYAFRQEEWFDAMEAIWESVREENERPEAAALLMARANRDHENPLQATVYYRQVIDWNGRLAGEADRELESLYRQLRSEPGTAVGRDVSRQEEVSRADLSALIIEELKLAEYMQGNTPTQYDAGFKTPQEFARRGEDDPLPLDVDGHPYEMDIREVIHFGIRGLEPMPDGSFAPQAAVNRASFALVIEDILIRVKEEPLLKTAFVGSPSPFPDVTPQHYAFNAMVVSTTRQFLAADLDGAFRPEDPATGAEALLAIRRLKEEIQAHQVNY